MAGLPLDELLTKSAFHWFLCLVESPICGLADLAEKEGDNDDGVVGDIVAPCDKCHKAGWEHRAFGLLSFH